MILKTISTKACCGSAAIYFILDKPLSLELITVFTSNGFTEQPKFAKQGIFFVYNDEYSLSGQIGNTKVNLTCKVKNCQNNTKLLNQLL